MFSAVTGRATGKQKDTMDDDISVTSSHDDEYTSDQEFEVERILAEKNVNGKKFYLILWKDYHEDKSTWEPKANIVDKGLVETWKTRRQLEQSGDAVPFDVAKFEARMKKLEEEKADRHRRRQAKRKSLGIPVSSSASDLDEVSDGDDADDSDSSVEATEENEIEEASRPRKSTTKRKKSVSPTKPVKKPFTNRVQGSDIQHKKDGSPDAQTVSRPLSNIIAAPDRLTSSKDVEKSKLLLKKADPASTLLSKSKSSRGENQRSSSSSSDVSLSKQRPAQRAAPLVTSLVSSREGSSLEDKASTQENFTGSHGRLSPEISSSSSRGGKGATRGGSKMTHKNVFQSRQSTNPVGRKRGSDLLANAMDPTKQPKKFTNKHLERKVYLQGRDRADRAIDPSFLPGGLINPSDGSVVQPIRPGTFRKSSFVPQNEEDPSREDGLFVDDNEPPNIRLPVATRADPLSKDHLICHYWFAQQKDSSKPPCQRGVQCDFLHEFRLNSKVAPPPPSKFFPLNPSNNPTTGDSFKRFSKSSTVCYFFDQQQKGATTSSCSKGRDCEYLHEYREGAPIARPPPSARPASTSTFTDKPTDPLVSTFSAETPPTLNDPSPPMKPPQPSSKSPLWGGNTLFETPLPIQSNSKESPSVDQILRSLSHMAPVSLPEPPPPSYNPREPGNAICYFWATKGSCKKGADCLHVHGDYKNLPIAPKPGSRPPLQNPPQDVARPEWDYWPPKEAPRSERDYQPLQESTRPEWDPRNPLHAICYFWANNEGHCNRGHSCKYIHSNDKSLPIAPSPKAQVCRFWPGDCKRGNNCPFIHERLRATENGFTEPDSYDSHTFDDTSNIVASPLNVDFSRSHQPPSEITRQDEPKTEPGTKSVKFAEGPPAIVQRFGEISSIDLAGTSKRGVIGPISRQLCPSLVSGACPYGKSCWYRHSDSPEERPDPSAMDIDVPPLDAVQIPFLRASKDVYMGDGDYQHAGSVNRDQTMSSLQNTESPPEMSTQSLNTPQPEAPKAKRKIGMKDYQRKKALEALGSRAKEVIFGSDETKSLLMDFGEMTASAQPSWVDIFTKQAKITFDQMCIANQFKAQQGFLQRRKLAMGNLTSAENDIETMKTLDKIVDELVLRSAGLMAKLDGFAILVFPAKKEEWKFLESDSGSTNDDVHLRFFIFSWDMDISYSYDDNEDKILRPYKMAMVRRMHGLQFKKLLPYCEKGQNPYHFYLMFPPEAAESEEFISAWIKTCKPESKIYSSRDAKSWDFFKSSPRIEFGVVLVHEAFTILHKVPGLYSVVNDQKKSISFWWISDSESPYSFYPSRYQAEVQPSRINAVRLFPHGCAFLLTPSFLVAEPQKAYELLNWFLGGQRAKYVRTTPRSWKLVCCYRLREYICDLANAKATEKEEFEKENQDKPAKDAMLKEKGLSFDHCEYRFKALQILVDLDNLDLLDESSEDEFGFGSDDSEDRESPMVYADRFVDQDDEPALIKWFAGWSIRKLDTYKRFVVVGTDPKSLSRLSRMKEVVDVEDARTAKFQSFSLGKTTREASPAELIPSARDRAVSIAKAKSVAAKYKKPSSPASSIPQTAESSTMSVTMPNKKPDQSEQQSDFEAQVMELIQTEANKQMKSMLQFDGAGDDGSRGRSSSNSRLNEPSNSRGPSITVGETFRAKSRQLKKNSVQIDIYPGDDIHVIKLVSGVTYFGENLNSRKKGQFVMSAEDFDPGLIYDGAGDETPTSSGSNNSKISKSGIQTSEDGQRFVPRTVHPDGSVRRGSPVRLGYTPPEDVEPWRPRKADGFSFLTVGSRRNSAGSVMDVDSGSDANLTPRKNKSRWHEKRVAEKVLKEIKYEPTTTWYEKLKAEGGGWEHMYVGGPENAFTVLGWGK